jgi:hypothetical protein
VFASRAPTASLGPVAQIQFNCRFKQRGITLDGQSSHRSLLCGQEGAVIAQGQWIQNGALFGATYRALLCKTVRTQQPMWSNAMLPADRCNEVLRGFGQRIDVAACCQFAQFV